MWQGVKGIKFAVSNSKTVFLCEAETGREAINSFILERGKGQFRLENSLSLVEDWDNGPEIHFVVNEIGLLVKYKMSNDLEQGKKIFRFMKIGYIL